ncbi:MAG: hypothetical protein M5U09_29745 [Gammaproteobacteria bacterium]|nr:hypothetical protein [Gammaproteobacteria bacterium]
MQHIVGVNPAAARAGVAAAMRPAEARALCATVALAPRDPARERRLLHRLADILGEFSSEVSVYGERTLVLEAGRSLRLFGGMDRLLERLGARPGEAGGYRHAVAPTPLAAALCAMNGLAVRVSDTADIRSALAPLPARALGGGRRNPADACGHGHRNPARPVPPAAPGADAALRRTLHPATGATPGERPEIPVPHRFRRRFRARHDLDQKPSTGGGHGRCRMPARGARAPTRVLRRRRRAPALDPRRRGKERSLVIDTRPGAPDWHAGRLGALLRLRLEAMPPTAPVRALVLVSGTIMPRSSRGQGSIPGIAPAAGRDHEFLDRLRARLGDDAVHGIRLRPEHRPEHAWSACEPGATGPALPPAAMRPLWLLPDPRPLPADERGPRLDGPLRLCGGEERIRHRLVGRRTGLSRLPTGPHPGGRRLWVFREVAHKRWYLHGLY